MRVPARILLNKKCQNETNLAFFYMCGLVCSFSPLQAQEEAAKRLMATRDMSSTSTKEVCLDGTKPNFSTILPNGFV